MNINLKQIDFIIIHSIFKIMESLLLPIIPSSACVTLAFISEIVYFERYYFWLKRMIMRASFYDSADECAVSYLFFISINAACWLRRIRAEMQQEILQHFRDVWSFILKSRCRHVAALWDFPQRNSSLYGVEIWLKLQWIINSINYSYTMIDSQKIN